MHHLYDAPHSNGSKSDKFVDNQFTPWEGLMFYELTGYPHDANAVQKFLPLQLWPARLA